MTFNHDILIMMATYLKERMHFNLLYCGCKKQIIQIIHYTEITNNNKTTSNVWVHIVKINF